LLEYVYSLLSKYESPYYFSIFSHSYFYVSISAVGFCENWQLPLSVDRKILNY